MSEPTTELAAFLAGTRFESLPQAVVLRAEELFLDWLASALAGRGARPTCIFESFAKAMGPANGSAELLTTRTTTSPFFAALVNGAASHVVEQDDLHNSSVFHPGTVVFPAVLAAAQDIGASGRAMADDELSLIRVKQDRRGLPSQGVRLGEMDWPGLARAMGCPGASASSPDELARAMVTAMDHPGPSLVEARIDPSGYSRMLQAIRG